jgi:hypothetical protein
MSFLEKEKPKEGEEEKKSSSFWDWVVGIGLVIVIGGFTVYYQYQKRSSISRFVQADSLYQAGRFREAGRLYEELKSAQYLTTKNDSVLYARMDTIETWQESQAALLSQAKTQLASGDTAAARKSAALVHYRDLLSDEDRAWLDSVNPVSAKP